MKDPSSKLTQMRLDLEEYDFIVQYIKVSSIFDIFINVCLFFFSSANAKKWEIELATLKSNNLRLTSALQESTANVDEWKRQLHSYKEENQRLKIRYQDLEASKDGGAAGSSGTSLAVGNADLTNELRNEIILLKNRIENLEKELMNQEIELKAANKSLKDKQNDPTVKQLTTLCSQFSIHMVELSGLQKEMEKVIQTHHKTT
ncbi:homer protein homolog 1-like [Ochlerotatus camptorhynchus]|uniref:homer protein homolog 1-like n=1 Tax=Ochlerotatus camptorhynchus TaxID=644619 RepID=UPI0031E3BF33